MAVDTFTSSLRLRLQGDGNNPLTWGQIADTDYQLIESALTGDNGYAGGSGAGINIGGMAGYTLTAANGTPDQARQMLYPFTGALTADCIVTMPGVVKIGWVLNATSGGFNVVLAVGSGTTLTVPPSTGWAMYYCDGVNVTAPPLALLGGEGGTTINGNLIVTGSSTLLGVLQMNNNTPIQAKNLAGNPGTAFIIGTDNFTNIFSRGGGVRLLNAAGALGLTLSEAGVVTTTGAIAAAGAVTAPSATLGGVALSGSNANVPGTVNAAAVNGTTGTIGGVTLSGSSLTLSGTVNAGIVDGFTGVIGGLTMAAGNASLGGTLSAGVVSTPSLGATSGVVGGVAMNGNNETVPGVLSVGGGTVGGGTGTFLIQSTAQLTPAAWAFSIGVTVANGVSAQGFLTFSDRRLKSDIEDITPTEGISWIMRARPRRYTIDGRPSAGFIAQEDILAGRGAAVVALPDDRAMFAEGDGIAESGTRLSRNYEVEIPFLVSALKWAIEEIENLTERIENLEEKGGV